MDVVSTINYIAKNVAGQALAWDFIRAQWNYISQLWVLFFVFKKSDLVITEKMP